MQTDRTGEMWFAWAADTLQLVAHTTQKPEAATWSAACRAVEDKLRRAPEIKTLVFTDGGGPSGAQREELARASGGKKYRVSVVSTAPGVRFIVTSMALFNLNIKCFQPSDWQQSLTHLGVAPGDIRSVEQAVRNFANQPGSERFAVLRAVLAAKPIASLADY